MRRLSLPAALVFTAVAACGGSPAPAHSDAKTCAIDAAPAPPGCDPCIDGSGNACGSACADACGACPPGCFPEPFA